MAWAPGGAVRTTHTLCEAMPTQMMNVFQNVKATEETEADYQPSSITAATVNEQGTSVLFDIPGVHTVKTDGQEVKVPILQESFPAHFRYSAVPKVAPRAYLKARMVNTTPFPLLPGEASVFFDNNFIATTRLKLVAPGEDEWVFLGVDSAISVRHKFLKKQEHTERRLLGVRRSKVSYEYVMEVKNMKRTPEEVVLWDQLPIPQDTQITVELLEPVYSGDTPFLKKSSVEYLEWFFRLAPGEQVTVPFKFSVEYPAGMDVAGLL